jgi:lipoate-protein ligase A
MMESLLTPGAVKLARHGAESVKARVVNLAQLAPEVTCQRVVEALKASFAAEYEVLPDENVEIPAVDESDKEKFRADRPLK